jgi:hypothetical protein
MPVAKPKALFKKPVRVIERNTVAKKATLQPKEIVMVARKENLIKYLSNIKGRRTKDVRTRQVQYLLSRGIDAKTFNKMNISLVELRKYFSGIDLYKLGYKLVDVIAVLRITEKLSFEELRSAFVGLGISPREVDMAIRQLQTTKTRYVP